MGYIVYQESGCLADAAREYGNLRVAGRLAEAVELYKRVMGDNRELKNEYGYLPCIDSTWWIYCADNAIRQNHGVDLSELSTDYWYSRAAAGELIKLATNKNGGTWRYYEEY